jgi:hypothetical protein
MSRRFARIAAAASLLLVLGACQVPGTVTFHKVDGRWEPKEVHVNMQNVNSANIATLQNHLNAN